jgi:nitrite reductase/ring-hydroxylating ferredoxin subunit
LETAADWLPVLAESELQDDQPRAVRVGGERLVVVRHNGRCVIVDRFCPHEHGDLAQGRILANSLKCPLHGFMYSLDNGRGINCRGRFSVRLHDVQVQDGMVRVRLSQAEKQTEPDAGFGSKIFRRGAQL